MHATTVAIDLAKDVFELAFADPAGRILERKRLSRRAFSRVLESRSPMEVVMEACGSAHYWGRRIQACGHAVRLLPPRDVRPYVRGNKTDRADAAGLVEAARSPQISEVPVKTPRQQGCRRCIACVSNSRRSARPRSTSCAACCASTESSSPLVLRGWRRRYVMRWRMPTTSCQ